MDDTKSNKNVEMAAPEAIVLPSGNININLHKDYIRRTQLWKTIGFNGMQKMFNASYCKVRLLVEELEKERK